MEQLTMDLEIVLPKASKKYTYWQEKCDELSIRLNAVMCVVEEIANGNCQIWHEWLVTRSMEKQPIYKFKVVYVSEVQ